MLFWFGIAQELLELNSMHLRISAAENAARAREFSDKQRARARTLHQNNPAKAAKQTAKAEVKAYWQLWDAQPDLYSSSANFAQDMLEKFDVLESPDVIKRWVTHWRSEAGR